jgi:hypothetical protein
MNDMAPAAGRVAEGVRSQRDEVDLYYRHWPRSGRAAP